MGRPARRRQVIGRPLALMLAACALISFGVGVARLGATYKAVSLGLPSSLVGLLAAAFAAVPMVVVVRFGRLTDRHGVRPGMLWGAGLILAAALLLVFASDRLALCFAAMALLGVGQTLHYSGLQMVVPLVSTQPHRDGILGLYLLASSIGGAVAPLAIGAAGTADPVAIARLLHAAGAVAAALLCVAAGLLSLSLRRSGGSRKAPALPLDQIARAPGVRSLLVAGCTCTTAQDLLATYVPALGIARGIAPGIVGALLAAESVASAASRLGFGGLTRRWGRARVAVGAGLAAGVGLAALALPLPVPLLFVALPVAGYGLGLAATATLAMLLAAAPRGARATAMSLRQLGNRVGLFGLPTSLGLLAAPLGVGGLFGILGALVGAAGLLALRGGRRGAA